MTRNLDHSDSDAFEFEILRGEEKMREGRKYLKNLFFEKKNLTMVFFVFYFLLIKHTI